MPACPLTSESVVAQVVGSPVHGGILTDFVNDTPLDTGPDKTVCWWDTDGNTSVTLSRQTNAFGPGGATTPAALTTASGIGDAAAWVFQRDPSINVASGGFVVQRGTDAIVFGMIGPDEPEAKSQATAFANAVLTTLVP